MSIDYAHLREWLDMVDRANPMPGDTITFTYPGSTVEIIRELLRLRDGVENVQEMCLVERDVAFHASPIRSEEVHVFNFCAEQLANLLFGATAP